MGVDPSGYPVVVSYTLETDDHVAYAMFNAWEFGNAKRRRKLFRRMLGGLGVALLAMNALLGEWMSLILVGIWLLITLLGYPAYQRWNYRRYYRKHYQQTTSKTAGQPLRLHLGKDVLLIEEGMEVRFDWNRASGFFESARHFFLRLESDALVLPKSQIKDEQELRDIISANGITIDDRALSTGELSRWASAT